MGPNTFFAKSRVPDGIEMPCAASIPPKQIDWVWLGFLAAGKFHILAGPPGTGKTGVALDMAATISNGGFHGRQWPDKAFATKGNVIIWSGEDGVEDTIIPRLIAAGADMSRIFILRATVEHGRSRPFNFAKDIPALIRKIEKIGSVSLLIIDSIVQAVAGDSNKNSDVRHALAPLVELGERHHCAVLGITHLSKGSKKKDPLDRVTGSLAYAATARVVMITAKVEAKQSDDEPASCVLVRVKSNIGLDDGGFEYRIQSTEIMAGFRSIPASRIIWGSQPLQGSAREILEYAEGRNQATGKVSALEAAAQFLRENLADKAQSWEDISILAQDAGISHATLKRAKSHLGVTSLRDFSSGTARSMWSLPPTSGAPAFDQGVTSIPTGLFAPAQLRPFAPVDLISTHFAESELQATAPDTDTEEEDDDQYQKDFNLAFAVAQTAALNALMTTNGDVNFATKCAREAGWSTTQNIDASNDAIDSAMRAAVELFNEG